MVCSFEALGTIWNVEFINSKLSSEKLKELSTIVLNFENDYSRFLPNSKLTILNKQQKFLNPSPEFIAMCRFALDSNTITNGIFNVGSGGILEKYGYGIPSSAYDIDSVPELAKSLLIKSDKIVLRNSLHLDFGGFGKGWLIDKLANWISYINIPDFIINAGGDIFSNIKTRILIKTPDNKAIMGSTVINKEAFAASSKKNKNLEKKPKRLPTHH